MGGRLAIDMALRNELTPRTDGGSISACGLSGLLISDLTAWVWRRITIFMKALPIPSTVIGGVCDDLPAAAAKENSDTLECVPIRDDNHPALAVFKKLCERHGGTLHVSNFADGEIQCLVTNQNELILSGHASQLFVSLVLIDERATG
ncbi:MAG: hypothetical protein QOJ40_360 [Verrucomicrobiota bacterium]